MITLGHAPHARHIMLLQVWNLKLSQDRLIVQIWLHPISCQNWGEPWRLLISSQTMKWRQQWNPPSKVSRENSSFAEWKNSLRVGETVFNFMLTAIILKSKCDILHLMNYTFIFFTFHFDNCSRFQNTCRQALCIFYKTRKSKELRFYLRSLSSTSPVLSLQITCLPKLCDSTFIRCPMYFQYQIRYSSGRI